MREHQINKEGGIKKYQTPIFRERNPWNLLNQPKYFYRIKNMLAEDTQELKYDGQKSEEENMRIYRERTREEQLINSPFSEQALSLFPHYFDEQARKEYLVRKEEELLENTVSPLKKKMIKVMRVDNFQDRKVLETWFAETQNMEIIHNAEGDICYNDIKRKIGDDKKTVEKKKNSKLHFGRSTGKGKVIRFEPIDISRVHFIIQKEKQFEQIQKDKINLLLCFKKTPNTSLWSKIPKSLSSIIMSYLNDPNYTPFQIFDFKSKCGTYMIERDPYPLQQLKHQIFLSEKGEITLRVVHLIESKVQNQEGFEEHFGKIKEFSRLLSLSNHEQNHDMFTFYPEYSHNYPKMKKKMEAEPSQNRPFALSSLMIEIKISDIEYKDIVLTNCEKDYSFGNGCFDVPILSTHAELGRQLIKIGYQDSKWMAKAGEKEEGLCVRLTPNMEMQVRKQICVKVAKSTRLVIEIPDII